MTLLKETISYCPKCIEKIPATVHEREDGIYMTKTCPAGHGDFDAFLERDKEYYKQYMQTKIIERDPMFISLMIPITHACNMNCYFCYTPTRSTKDDFPKEKVLEIIRNSRANHFLLTGGEPTVSPYLFDYIKAIRDKNKWVSIATNGLKLEDKAYVKALRDAGVNDVTMSLYGFDDETYLKITGIPNMMRNRERVFKNLRKYRMPLNFSFTISEHLKPEYIGKVFETALQNLDFIYQIRMRSVTPAGSGAHETPFCIGRLLDIYAEIFDTTPEELKEFDRNAGPIVEHTWNKSLNIPKNPMLYELDIIRFLEHQASRGNNRCKQLLNMRPKRYKKSNDIRMTGDYLVLAAWKWHTPYTADYIELINIPLGYYTYSHGETGLVIALALAGNGMDI